MAGSSSARQAELTEAATDYVLEHGLIGLSLRPLAAAIGTSDRMLVYHFGSKDDLVATVLQECNDRSVAQLRAMPPATDPRAAVLELWSALREPRLARCQRAYVEAAALGLFGREPYVSTVRRSNRDWLEAAVDHLVASGVPRSRADRAVELLDATMMGLLLDLQLDPEGPERTVRDLADAVAAIAAE